MPSSSTVSDQAPFQTEQCQTGENPPIIPSTETVTNDPAIFKLQQRPTDAQKLAILTSKKTDSSTFNYPQTNGRRYLPSWETQYPWLKYSDSENAAYCKFCLTFGDKVYLFSDKGFNDWKNAVGKIRSAFRTHDENRAHKDAVEKAMHFISICEGEEKNICSSISRAYEERVKRNREILISIIDVVIILGQRNIAFRGNWDKVKQEEDGNFKFFVRWKAEYDTVLKKHIETAHRSMTYLSPTIQNELIQCCELEIRDNIIVKCNEAGYFAVIADETTDVSVTEQLSVCIRYVDTDTCEVREEILGFVELNWIPNTLQIL